jgi:hypothetical protein
MIALRRSFKLGPPLPFECLNSINCGGWYRLPNQALGDEGECESTPRAWVGQRNGPGAVG